MKMWSHQEVEIGKMIELVFATERKNFLEIGSHMFNFSVMFYLLSGKGGRIITIDVENRHPDRLEIMKMYAPNFIFIQGNSNSEDTLNIVKKTIKEELFDIVYIDGSHNYTQVKKDSELYGNLVKPNGYIIWHDYFVAGENCATEHGRFQGVNKYITETKKPIQSFFKDGSCLAYIRGEQWISNQK